MDGHPAHGVATMDVTVPNLTVICFDVERLGKFGKI